MLSWAAFETAAPDLAAAGRRLIERDGAGQAALATVRHAEPPRIHPIDLAIVDGRLVAFLLASAKRIDLERDGRYALHAHLDPALPSKFLVRGRARRIDDPAVRAPSAAGWSFEVDEAYDLYEFGLESALLGERAADEWPPRYTRWSSSDASDRSR